MCDIFFDIALSDQKETSVSCSACVVPVKVRGAKAQEILNGYRALTDKRGKGYRSPELEIRAYVDTALLQQFAHIEESSDRLWLLKEFYETSADDQRMRLFYGHDLVKIVHANLPLVKNISEKCTIGKWAHDAINGQMTSTKTAPYVRPILAELWACVKSMTNHDLKRSELNDFIQRAGHKFRFSPVWGVTTKRVHHPILLARANALRLHTYGLKPAHPDGFQMGYWLSYGVARIRPR